MTPCWPWRTVRKSDGRAIAGRTYAYILVWEAANGPLPEGLSLHHVCENSACVRPDHLEPITQAEHARLHLTEQNRNRKRTHCPSGHPYTPENTRIVKDKRGNYRACRTCLVAAKRRYNERINTWA